VSTHRTPFANVDAAWLRMDEPNNHMVVTGVLIFETPLTEQRVRALLRRTLLRFARFRQRIVPPFAGVGLPSWERDPRFSLDHHLSVERLRDPADEATLQELVSGLADQPFPPRRPPWRMYLVPHFQGGSALIVRIHHCVGDGLALVHVLLSMADGAPGLVPGSTGPKPSRWETLLSSVTAARRTLPMAADHVGSLLRLLLLPPDPPTRFKGPLRKPKKLVWSRPFLLEDFKKVGRATGSTVNDVLMAALAGALRRYLLDHAALKGTLDIRGVVPVNLRPAGEAHLLGNQFGLVFLPLRLGLATPGARLAEVRRRMRELKRSPGAAAIYELLWLMGIAPRPLFDAVLDLFATKATAVVTNVIGPGEPLTILGARLRQAMFWVPCAGHLGLGVSLLSYAGRVWVGVQSDVSLVPDPERIVSAFEEEVEALRLIRPSRKRTSARRDEVPAAVR
jgi:WS/DGAT/MGAT family acyltransferase